MSPSADTVAASVLLLGVLLLGAAGLRFHWPLAQRLFLPSSVIAGAAALLIGPEVLGRAAEAVLGDGVALADGLVPDDVRAVWAELPALLISVVFAGLFLGRPLPGVRRVQHAAMRVDVAGLEPATSRV